VLLEWASAEGRTYAIEACDDLRRFRSVKTGLPATPPLNRFELEESEANISAFYRVRLEGAAAR
jgi:hypothetical protein